MKLIDGKYVFICGHNTYLLIENVKEEKKEEKPPLVFQFKEDYELKDLYIDDKIEHNFKNYTILSKQLNDYNKRTKQKIVKPLYSRKQLKK